MNDEFFEFIDNLILANYKYTLTHNFATLKSESLLKNRRFKSGNTVHVINQSKSKSAM